MSQDLQLTLDKFGSIGGDYFEHLVAVALDELGYVEGDTYVASWAKKCVPGTWIEADFIISNKTDKSKDPLNNGRIVLAIGHATSENSAGMKFHRDVEQLLEVKALANGDEYRVMDILFCCPRETMGGWSKELVAINEAIFDNSLIVWKHDWGMRLLQQIQLHGEKLSQGDNGAKKKKLKDLLSKHTAFRRQFEALRDHLGAMLSDKKSHSRISDIFEEERKQLPKRLAMPLLIDEPEKTDFKRGLLQVLALNSWEVGLLHRNHQENKNGKVYPLEKLALENGMSPEDFDQWWERLQLLSVKLGSCSADFIGDEMLVADAKEWRMFKASKELGYVMERFDRSSLSAVVAAVPRVAPNLVPYTIDLQDLGRANTVCELLHREKRTKFVSLCIECYLNDPWKGMSMPRLLIFEVAKAAIKSKDSRYSYDVIANESGHSKLIQYPGFFRGIHPGKRGNPNTDEFTAGCASVQKRLTGLDSQIFNAERMSILQRFIYERLDGMVKQPKGSVLDALMDAEISNFGKRIGAAVSSATIQGLPSAFNVLIGRDLAGVNVEVPYVLTLKGGKRILIHRVMADGGVGHKRKEFASKIRTIRYQSAKRGFELHKDIAATIIVLDGNWVTPDLEDKLTPFRMLTVAGWDYVVYPDQLSEAFARIEKSLGIGKKVIPLPTPAALPQAAEAEPTPKLKKKGNG
jgi:hypothetical protein